MSASHAPSPGPSPSPNPLATPAFGEFEFDGLQAPPLHLDTPVLSSALVPVPQQVRRDASIADLQSTMNAFMASMDQRMHRLEQAMFQVQRSVQEHQPLANELRSVLQYIINSGQLPHVLALNSAQQVAQAQPEAHPQQAMGLAEEHHNEHHGGGDDGDGDADGDGDDAGMVSPDAPAPPFQGNAAGVFAQPAEGAAAEGPNLLQPLQHMQPTPQPQAPQDPGLAIRFKEITTKWFTERIYPPFTVEVYEVSTGEVFRKTHDWEVVLRLRDGNGNLMDDRMGDLASRTLTLKDGAAEATGLKFTVVSSKNGNFFTIEAELSKPENVVPHVKAATSEHIVVLSCRLFHNPKRPLKELSADDQLSKMPGIGRLYAERFAAVGYQTIRQLAGVPLDPNGRTIRLQLLNHLRRDKGTLTETKLTEYVEKALEIVRKSDAMSQLEGYSMPLAAHSDEPSPKKARIGSPNMAPESHFNVNVDDFINYTDEPSPSNGPAPAPPLNLGVAGEQDGLGGSWLNDPIHRSAPLPHVPPMPFQHPNTNGFAAPSPMSKPGTVPVGMGAPPLGTPRSQVKASIQYPLHNAIGTRDMGLVRSVVNAMREGGLPLNEENSAGWTPLMLAAAVGQAELVEFLCSLPEVDATQQSSVNGMSALHAAACQGHGKTLQVLLRQPGVDAGVLNKAQYTPLMVAVVKANVEATRILSKIADSYRPKTAAGISLYHLAALSGSVEAIQCVHDGLRTYAFASQVPGGKYGALVLDDKADRPGVPSVLHCAAFAGSPEVLRWLFEQGVRANVVNEDGWTALHFAAFRGNAACIPILTSRIDPNIQTTQGWTPLALAAMSNAPNSDATVHALVAAGAKDEAGHIPANLVSVSTGNMRALEALQGCRGTCLGTKAKVQGVGEVSPMEVGSFFNNTDQLELVKQRLQANKSPTPNLDELSLQPVDPSALEEDDEGDVPLDLN